jgi:hypothetical protein
MQNSTSTSAKLVLKKQSTESLHGLSVIQWNKLIKCRYFIAKSQKFNALKNSYIHIPATLKMCNTSFMLRQPNTGSCSPKIRMLTNFWTCAQGYLSPLQHQLSTKNHVPRFLLPKFKLCSSILVGDRTQNATSNLTSNDNCRHMVLRVLHPTLKIYDQMHFRGKLNPRSLP